MHDPFEGDLKVPNASEIDSIITERSVSPVDSIRIEMDRGHFNFDVLDILSQVWGGRDTVVEQLYLAKLGRAIRASKTIGEIIDIARRDSKWYVIEEYVRDGGLERACLTALENLEKMAPKKEIFIPPTKIGPEPPGIIVPNMQYTIKTRFNTLYPVVKLVIRKEGKLIEEKVKCYRYLKVGPIAESIHELHPKTGKIMHEMVIVEEVKRTGRTSGTQYGVEVSV